MIVKIFAVVVLIFSLFSNEVAGAAAPCPYQAASVIQLPFPGMQTIPAVNIGFQSPNFQTPTLQSGTAISFNPTTDIIKFNQAGIYRINSNLINFVTFATSSIHTISMGLRNVTLNQDVGQLMHVQMFYDFVNAAAVPENWNGDILVRVTNTSHDYQIQWLSNINSPMVGIFQPGYFEIEYIGGL